MRVSQGLGPLWPVGRGGEQGLPPNNLHNVHVQMPPKEPKEHHPAKISSSSKVKPAAKKKSKKEKEKSKKEKKKAVVWEERTKAVLAMFDSEAMRAKS